MPHASTGDAQVVVEATIARGSWDAEMMHALKQYMAFRRGMRAWRDVEALYWSRCTVETRWFLLHAVRPSIHTHLMLGALFAAALILVGALVAALQVVRADVGGPSDFMGSGVLYTVASILVVIAGLVWFFRAMTRRVQRWVREAMAMRRDLRSLPWNERSMSEIEFAARNFDAIHYLRCVQARRPFLAIDVRVLKRLSGLESESVQGYEKETRHVLSRAMYGEAASGKR